MTAVELYECDPGFRGFMQVWCDQRRCPLELVDYLLDRDMVRQAECCRWMHEGDSFYSYATEVGSGRFPWRLMSGDWIFRPARSDNKKDMWAHRVVGIVQDVEAPSAIMCILKTIDAWNPRLAAALMQ